MTREPDPPQWAEALLRIVLDPTQFESVSGDLLEEYRAAVYPARGEARADWWYARQVLGFIWQDVRIWGILFGSAFVVRVGIDRFVPTRDFHERAMASTGVAVGLVVTAGLVASWRSGSPFAGAVAGMATAAIGAAVSLAGSAALLVIWHDAQGMATIHASGGLSEVFILPVLVIVPAAFFGSVGGLAGAAARALAQDREPGA
jgi:hypothetical protein